RTIARVGARRPTGLEVAGIVVNRLGRTRDARHWAEQLTADYADQVLPPIELRAAIAEASAQSLPLHALGNRPGAAEAIAQFEAVLTAMLGRDRVAEPADPSPEDPDAQLRPPTFPIPSAGR